ncbi:DUF7552 domain-containing protein [Halobellus rufus]|uniref:DUF7552 domain-containing protein n=1 Tax=Halobellus rufus TaxID=1448860 RepID=UPI000678C227|nr:hypothetical protein [Halobellus rufus]
MTEPTLTTLRSRIESLAGDGAFVVCGRTGERPVPVGGWRFETRAQATRAARVAEEYRAALRRYDPALPHYDLIVVEDRPVRREWEAVSPSTPVTHTG